MDPATSAPVEDPPIHILWINAGLSCDGDSVSLTAAMQPSIEEIVTGVLPGLPKIQVHWPLIDFECGPVGGADTFIEWFFKGERGEIDPFVLVVEGSIPNEKIKPEGYWCGFGDDPETGQPITTSEWIDRLAPKALAVVAIGTCATYGGIHAMEGNPTGAMGVPDYLGWNWTSKAGIPIVCVPGCPIQPDNFSETLTYLLYQAAGSAPMIPLDDKLRPTWLFGATVHEGCDRAGLLRAGPVRRDLRLARVPGQTRLLGSRRQVQRAQARLDERHRRLPQRRRHLHRLHDAGLPRQVHALHGRASRRQGVDQGQRRVRGRHPQAPLDHRAHGGPGAQVAPQRPEADHGLPPALVTDPQVLTSLTNSVQKKGHGRHDGTEDEGGR